MGTPLISVIIPVLNEATTLPRTLAAVQSATVPIEILVVDGGSEDGTCEVARSLGNCSILTSPPGRAMQMNRGAAIAQGKILLFLHGDTQLPADYDQWVQQTLAQPKVIVGAFRLAIDSPSWQLRGVEWGVEWRSRLLQLPYGDQALFMKAAIFRRLGGFPSLPIMEDFALVQRARTLGNVAIAPIAVTTSSRRWQTLGVARTTVINQLMILGYFLGIPPERLAQWYRGLARR